MARIPKVPRAMREARRLVEKSFCRAERALLGVDPAPALAPAAQFVGLEESLQKLHPDDAAGRDALMRRLQELKGAASDPVHKRRYMERHGVAEVTCTRVSTGERIYRIVITTFPGHENYIYLVMSERGAILVDVGSGKYSRPDVLAGFEVVRAAWGEDVAVEKLAAVFISHAHIDHFGDVAYFQKQSGAPVMVHELDARVLTRFEERMVVAAKDMGVFFARAGVTEQERQQLETMYLASKDAFKSVEVDRRLRHGDKVLSEHEVIHTPGHCPGHLCMRVGNALLVADQVLNPITPNLSPQSITAFNGLESYINSLLKLRALDGVDHVLPAHANPIPSLSARIDEILEHHQDRLGVVQDACVKPCTVAEISQVLYGKQEGYNVILALTESGAHVEYLYHHGKLRIANLDHVASQRDPVIQYLTA